MSAPRESEAVYSARLRRVLVSIALVLGGACSLRQAPPPGATGDEIYALQNCANCHGLDRKGMPNGPALADLERHWTRDTLAEFLRDPKAFVKTDARVAALKNQYSTGMGRYDALTLDQRLVLASWLLTNR